ncbi:MAG: glycosyltransferase family 4 protein [Sulfitobacter sp.]|nr:glycosyltransferase family 4 protein [Sulfitobacter sp.]
MSVGQTEPGESHDSPPDKVEISAAAEDSLRLLSVCETAQGGVGRYQENILALDRRGIDPWVLLPDRDWAILGDHTQVNTFRRRGRGPRSLLALIGGFLAERRRLSPDIYLFNSTFSLLPLLLLRALGDRSPAIYCSHCWAVATQEKLGWKSRLIEAVEGRLCGLADLIVNVSQADADTAVRRGYRGRHIVVENAVSGADAGGQKEMFRGPDETGIHLLFVGRFDRQKGLDILLPAFARARAARPDLHLHLVGGAVRGSPAPDLPEGVTNHGWVSPDQIDSYYRSADALIVPSRWEGMPLVVLEALRNGTPVLLSRGCRMDDLLAETGCGKAFDLNEETVVNLLTDLAPKSLQDMRKKALEAYDAHFTLDRFTAEFAEHVMALAEGRPRA